MVFIGFLKYKWDQQRTNESKIYLKYRSKNEQYCVMLIFDNFENISWDLKSWMTNKEHEISIISVNDWKIMLLVIIIELDLIRFSGKSHLYKS
jgi:hypothetical protein